MTQSYASVTELPGGRATGEQLAMLYARYHLAAGMSQGKDVLEVACGAGIGLGYLAKYARTVVGSDYDEHILRYARAHYGNYVRLLRLDAHALPFCTQAFDIVILFEALYYLATPERFIEEARRVLRPGGAILVCIVNKDFPGFNPSPFTHRYLSVPELHALLKSFGFHTEVYGGFSVNMTTLRDRALGVVRQLAVRLHLIPPTMRGKEFLKRLVYGKLAPIPHEVVEEMAELQPLSTLPVEAPTGAFKVLYVVGRLP